MKAYTCWGSVRGGCGKAHRTIVAALSCQRHDHHGCAQSQGGYSDRATRQIDERGEATSHDTQRGPGERVPDGELEDAMEAAQ